MTRLLPFAAFSLLAACVSTPPAIQQGLADIGLVEQPEPEVAPVQPLPREVIDALPPGAPTSTVIVDSSGCYLFTVELTNPPSGYPVRDANGTPLCEGNTGEPIFTNGYQAPLPGGAVAVADGGFVPPFAGADGGTGTAEPIAN